MTNHVDALSGPLALPAEIPDPCATRADDWYGAWEVFPHRDAYKARPCRNSPRKSSEKMGRTLEGLKIWIR